MRVKYILNCSYTDIISDAIDIKSKQPVTNAGNNDVDDEDVYELAQTSAEMQDLPPQKKPSPKPRAARQMTPKRKSSTSSKKAENETDTTSSEAPQGSISCAAHEPSVETQALKKRPGKKVVEIEYEVASEIRRGKPGESSVTGISQADYNPDGAKTSINDSKKPKSASQISQFSKVNVHNSSFDSKSVKQGPTGSQSQQPHTDFVYSLGQASSHLVVGEDAYEEPWDLKMKRLKQEQESKGKKSVNRSDKLPGMQKAAAIYDNAWHAAGQQQKLQDRQSYARSLSHTSEVDVFHDALDSFPDQMVIYKQRNCELTYFNSVNV